MTVQRVPLSHPPFLLLDTNALSPEKLDDIGFQHGLALVTASTSAQELLGMQRPGKETGYRYALPMLNDHLTLLTQDRPGQLVRWVSDHAKHRPVARQTDTLVVPASRLRQEARELGHAAVAIAHETGQDRLFRAYASRGLRAKQLRRVLDKWEFLRSEIKAVIPLDDTIASYAVVLANQFVDSGQRPKGTVRNTMNDMYVAATSLATGIPLVTEDCQLGTFYREHGWKVMAEGDVYIASPNPPSNDEISRSASAQQDDYYVNRPQNLRAHINMAPQPPVR